jgi:hypothetical protein
MAPNSDVCVCVCVFVCERDKNLEQRIKIKFCVTIGTIKQ